MLHLFLLFTFRILRGESLGGCLGFCYSPNRFGGLDPFIPTRRYDPRQAGSPTELTP